MALENAPNSVLEREIGRRLSFECESHRNRRNDGYRGRHGVGHQIQVGSTKTKTVKTTLEYIPVTVLLTWFRSWGYKQPSPAYAQIHVWSVFKCTRARDGRVERDEHDLQVTRTR